MIVAVMPNGTRCRLDLDASAEELVGRLEKPAHPDGTPKDSFWLRAVGGIWVNLAHAVQLFDADQHGNPLEEMVGV